MLSLANSLAGIVGYPKAVRWVINRSPTDMNLDIDGEVGFNTYFNGDISSKKGSEIHNGVNLHGDINIGEKASIGPWTEIRGSVTVGRYTNLVRDNWVRGDVSIGGFCAIAPKTAIQGTNHDFEHFAVQQRWQREVLDTEIPPTTEEIVIGSDVWMGRNVIVLPGVEIGHGACIGAGTVVTRDVKPYEIVAGVPNEHLNWRFPEEIRDELLSMKWWEWDEEKLRKESGMLEDLVSYADV